MKKVCLFSLVCIFALLAGACVREEVRDGQGRGDVVIRLSVEGLSTRAATEPGTGEENTVGMLDVIVFDGTGTQQLYYSHVASPSLVDGYYVQSTTVAQMSNMGDDPAATLQSAKVFAVANYPGDATVFTGKTLAQVKGLAVSADNASNAPSRGKFIYPDDTRYLTLDTPSFVMTSEGGFSPSGNEIVADLSLRRLAAKVSLTLTYPASIVTEGNVFYDGDVPYETTTRWEPLTGENPRVYLDNGALEATLGGPASTPQAFRYEDTHPSDGSTVDFYTYPLSWDAGSDRAPFVKIIQPWHYKTFYTLEIAGAEDVQVYVEENVVELYYKVLFPGLEELESDTWYQFTVDLSVLGGEVDSPVVLQPIGLTVLDWGTVSQEDISDIDIQPVVYLVPDSDDVKVESGSTVSVHYIASDVPTLVVNAIYQEVFINNGRKTVHIYPEEDSGVTDHYNNTWFSNEYDPDTREGTITLNHKLSGDFDDPNFSARPYIYELSLNLAGIDPQEITITQTPPFLAEGSWASGFVAVNGSVSAQNNASPRQYKPATRIEENPTSNPTPSASSYIYTNGLYSSSTATTNLGTINGYIFLDKDATNSSQWRIIVRPTVGEDRYLQDPRITLSGPTASDTDQARLNGIVNFAERRNTNGTYRSLYTYPALTGSTNTDIQKYRPAQRIVEASPDPNKPNPLPGTAPEFMIASSYGKTYPTNYASSVLRCASYQEDGYPAGRWRLPTEDEIAIAIKLSQKGAIPSLFDGRYWASSGRFYYSGASTDNWVTATDAQLGGGTTNPQIGARCVYDTWYWGREEVTALRTTSFETNYNNQQYRWSGYSYSSK